MRGIITDRETLEMLDRIIGTTIIGVVAIQLDGDIYFPELYRYVFDEDGKGHKCED